MKRGGPDGRLGTRVAPFCDGTAALWNQYLEEAVAVATTASN